MSESPEKDLSIQNEFFNQARKARTRVTLFLTSGKRLVGKIKSFDRFTIILDAGGGAEEMIFKHAIATISTSTRPHALDTRAGESRPGRVEPSGRPIVPTPQTTTAATVPAVAPAGAPGSDPAKS